MFMYLYWFSYVYSPARLDVRRPRALLDLPRAGERG